MVRGKHKPPSRVRYELSHPVFSCRLDKQAHDLLQARLDADGLSFAEFVKAQLGVLELKMQDINRIEKEAYKKGYDNATTEYRIQMLCRNCGKTIIVMPNSNLHKAIKEHLEGVWFHTDCL
jgi:hypothetical protein